ASLDHRDKPGGDDAESHSHIGPSSLPGLSRRSTHHVIPAKAGIHSSPEFSGRVDSRLRGDDAGLMLVVCSPSLAKAMINSHIAGREVGADVFLANRVRSGRKQPQRDPHGSLPASYFTMRFRWTSSAAQLPATPTAL